MIKLWLIAKSNIKKKKSNMVTMFLLVVISVVLMYSSMNVVMNVGSFISEKSAAQNGAHASVVATKNYKDEVVDILKGTDGFKDIDVVERQITSVACDITNLSLEKENKETMTMFFQDMNVYHDINNLKVIDEGDVKSDNSIILPMYLKVARGYKTGDKIQVKINQIIKNFVVYGFTEDVMFASPANIPVFNCQISGEMMEELLEEGSTVERYQYNILLNDSTASEEYESAALKQLTNKMTYADFGTDYVMNIQTMIAGSTTMINIIMSMITVFSVLLILIVIFVIRFNLVMYFEENLSNIGIMEAQGYTTTQLKCAMLMEYMIVCVLGIGVGFVAAGATSSIISNLVSSSIGQTWTPSTEVGLGIAVSAVIILFIAFIVIGTSRRLKKITTLDALRGGIETHNFKRNYLPLSHSKLDVNTSIGLKNLLHNTKQNIGVVVIVSLLSFASVLTMLIFYNFVEDDKSLLTLIGMEPCDIEVTAADRSEEELGKLMDELVRSENIDHGILCGSVVVTIYDEHEEISAETDIYSDFDALAIDTIYEGRVPQYENEIIITTVIANRLNLNVGDSVHVKMGENSESYIVCGISQQITQNGIGCKMKKDGIKRIAPEFSYSTINLYVKDESIVQSVVDELEQIYEADEEMKISNFNEVFATTMDSFTSAIVAVCSVAVIVTLIVIAMIVIMMMRMKMIRERKLIGIYKALGYTTPQIIWQMVMAFAPIVTLGGVFGSILGAVSVNQIFVMVLSFCQIKNASIQIHGGLIASCIIGVTIVAFMVSILVSAKARTIEPYRMISVS